MGAENEGVVVMNDARAAAEVEEGTRKREKIIYISVDIKVRLPLQQTSMLTDVEYIVFTLT